MSASDLTDIHLMQRVKKRKARKQKERERGKKKKNEEKLYSFAECLCLGAFFQGLAMPFIILPYPSFPTYHEFKIQPKVEA